MSKLSLNPNSMSPGGFTHTAIINSTKYLVQRQLEHYKHAFRSNSAKATKDYEDVGMTFCKVKTKKV